MLKLVRKKMSSRENFNSLPKVDQKQKKRRLKEAA